MKKKLWFVFLFIFFICQSLTLASQTVYDSIGNTQVEISVAVNTNYFLGGFTSGPWDLYWGPDQKLWFTNRKELNTYDPVTQVVDTLLSIPSGYIMGVTTHGDFFNHPYVYLTIDTDSYYGIGRSINLFRYDYSLTGDSLYNPQFILQWDHPSEHSGGRVIYGLDDKLYVTTAEYGYRPFNDPLFYNSGKVLRVNPDGSVPADNPKADYTFTFGHRNPQGIVQAPNGNLFVSEYGFHIDELNLLEVNRFYGWSIFDGSDCNTNLDTCAYYDSLTVFPISEGVHPPSGIDYYEHPAIPGLNGLVQAITGREQGLIVYTMNATFDSVMQKSYYITGKFGRVRDACASPDGSLYFIANDRVTAHIRVIKNPLYTGIRHEPKTNFNFFPNPASGDIIYNIHPEGDATISIHDLGGKNIFNRHVAGQSGLVDIRDIPAGFYFISIRMMNGSNLFEKTGQSELNPVPESLSFPCYRKCSAETLVIANGAKSLTSCASLLIQWVIHKVHSAGAKAAKGRVCITLLYPAINGGAINARAGEGFPEGFQIFPNLHKFAKTAKAGRLAFRKSRKHL